MELTGLQIFKYLPGGKKTEHANCKACKQPTCMAFALKLAKQQVNPTDCPHIPEELVRTFLDSVKKQQNEIVFGADNLAEKTRVGNETVMFRHEKTFVNKTAIAFELDSEDADFEEKLNRIGKYEIERVGEKFRVETIYLKGGKNLVKCAKTVSDKGFSLIIKTDDDSVINELKNLNPIFDTTNYAGEDIISTATGASIREIAEKSSELLQKGAKHIVLELKTEGKTAAEIIEELTYIRRLAILKKNESFAWPTLVKLPKQNLYKTTSLASLLLCRYANILVFPEFDEAMVTTVFTLRQNIYTDPQKPLQVEAKIYEFNDPDENSIVMMTTNFALTYFAVANEIEAIGRPTYLVVTASDGMSVLTAWSADKFTSELAAKTLKEADLSSKVKHRRIIIPGLLSHMKEELEEEMPDWEFLVGPIEAYQLPEFVKSNC